MNCEREQRCKTQPVQKMIHFKSRSSKQNANASFSALKGIQNERSQQAGSHHSHNVHGDLQRSSGPKWSQVVHLLHEFTTSAMNAAAWSPTWIIAAAEPGSALSICNLCRIQGEAPSILATLGAIHGHTLILMNIFGCFRCFTWANAGLAEGQ